ncbi:Predicted DNA-binding protein, UPF0251 family [Geoalkalibacter ferrihydriticus]|uniref:UPF0251 protein GFER_13335 n=2 Tax=Geoalkalibacter ferrihydriticus TaxID=392333 RepID=A0A0C2HG32_9BACT|nr:DUF134 domain-containing protein [Geoalkalibacter ferrihydriticus]KIH75906.1 hypothetical protein GFER_13335 [Geoalkalibacter ferrihydriticus DSM 17813]SDM54404.1 Predicted DNA-binding protein, UPF0251 family [Geoalkalibacter ferrihydriticus]
MSPRPRKPRNCACPHHPPDGSVFKPAGTPMRDLEKIYLDHDEFDALHLCDGEGMTQEQAGERLGVSRGTVQRLTASGRKKIIEALAEGRALIIAADGEED